MPLVSGAVYFPCCGADFYISIIERIKGELDFYPKAKKLPGLKPGSGADRNKLLSHQ